MNKLIVLFFSILLITPCYAFEWEEFYQDEKQQKTAFVDLESLVNAVNSPSPNKILWGKTIYGKDKVIIHIKLEVDCKNRRNKTLEVRMYDIEEKQLIKTVKDDDEWSELQAGTMPALACERFK